ncbi:hypothetical protein GH714_042373 [Hevea brasiliensis]|uniref:RNase H type-1 domain-containing protein n=1 Tax=Hevea brasiliensis TaxID=3981 RepID=A0A6A6L834_HEVBR|nr:hypothetical protein GH714_042373 [Hevea brasiliensis]
MRCFSCLGPKNPSSRDIIIKQNGKIIKAKQGTLVKHIVASHPNHIVLQAESKSSVPSFLLGCCNENEMFFVVAEGQALSKFETLKTLVRSRKDGGGGCSGRVGDRKKQLSPGNSSDKNGNRKLPQQLKNNASFEYKKLPWKPALHTIPEIQSPQNFQQLGGSLGKGGYVDATIFSAHNRTGFSALLRDSKGCFVVAVSGFWNGCLTPHMVEALSLREALSWLLDHRLANRAAHALARDTVS